MTHHENSGGQDGPLAVFDLDGTLIDTAPDLTHALNAALMSQNLPTVSLDVVRDAIGHGARQMIIDALASQRHDASEEIVGRMHKAFLVYYGDHIAVDSAPYPGMIAALDVLEARGFRLAVCTNKYEALARQLLKELGLDTRFSAIAGGDTYGVAKPDPKHLLRTIEAAGGGPAIMVGDSASDTRAAQAAGVPVIAVTFGYTGIPVEELGADAVISHYDELIPAIDANI